MTREVWPTDEAFRKFAARVADGVTAHINNGGTITVSALGCAPDYLMPGYGGSCKCPLGTISHVPFPDGREVPVNIKLADRRAFIRGFDFGYSDKLTTSPYYRLGRAYRQWALARQEPR